MTRHQFVQFQSARIIQFYQARNIFPEAYRTHGASGKFPAGHEIHGVKCTELLAMTVTDNAGGAVPGRHQETLPEDLYTGYRDYHEIGTTSVCDLVHLFYRILLSSGIDRMASSEQLCRF